MRSVPNGRWAWLMGVAILATTSCQDRQGIQLTSEVDEPHYRRGRQVLRSGQNQVALEAFLKVIEKRNGDAPESHLDVGKIYLDHIQDPIAAIYHFRKYLELRPNSQQSRVVRQLIDTSKKQFAFTLPGQPLDDHYERVDLLDLVERLQNENNQMRSELAAIRAQPLPTSEVRSNPRTTTAIASSGFVRSPPNVAQTNSTRSKQHEVIRGETLYSISKLYYGTGNRWREIYLTNRSVMMSETDLKVGTQLVIP
jgi:tetratricopeptide (TPR) repeat protein